MRLFKMLSWSFRQSDSAFVLIAGFVVSCILAGLWCLVGVLITVLTHWTIGLAVFCAPFIHYLARKYEEHESK